MKTVIILNADAMGHGDASLGARIMASFIDTLSSMDELPAAIVLYNGAVRLLRPDTPWLDALKRLDDGGVDLLACVTCLEHFTLTDAMAVGRVSNMREITRTLLAADNVITI